MTSAFSWQNSISLCPASFCIPRPNLPVTPGVSWLPTLAFQSPITKRTSLGVLFLEGLVGLHRTNTQKRCPFHYRGLECKSRKSRNTWRNRQIWPWNAEWSRAKTNRVLPRKCTGHSKHSFLTTQEKTLRMDITGWSTPKSDWLYSLQPKMEKLYTVNKNKTRSWLWLRSWIP